MNDDFTIKHIIALKSYDSIYGRILKIFKYSFKIYVKMIGFLLIITILLVRTGLLNWFVCVCVRERERER